MATSPASNWEDRLAATAASLPTPASNWEDRLRSLDLSPKPNPAEGDGSTLRIGLGDMLGGRLNVDTGIPIGQGTANFLAGAGAGLTNLARGVGQKVGLVSAGDIHEARKLDAPLMDTWAGKAGDLAGTAAGSLPAVLIPGAGTYAGAAKVGAGLGLLAPAESFGELAGNTALGGVGGAAGNVAGRALGSLYGLGKSAVMPFFESGQKSLAGDAIARFAGDPKAVAAALRANRGPQILPDVMPAAAEVAQTPGLADLQTQIRQLSPGVNDAFVARQAANDAARVAALQTRVAGQPGQIEALIAARGEIADGMYGAARRTGIDPAALTPQAQTNIASFAQRIPPDALARARVIAQLKGEPMDNSTSLAGLHWMKQGVDSALSAAKTGGDTTMASALSGLQSDLMTGLTNLSPMYGTANEVFRAMSQPINRMQVGEALMKRLVPAINDYGGNAPLRQNMFAQALREGDTTAAGATGFPGSTMENTLSYKQLATITAVAEDVARSGNVARLASIPGANSGTAKNLVSQNIVRNTLGPLGLPDSVAKNTLVQTLLYPAQVAGTLAEPKVAAKIGETLLSPEATAQALEAAAARAGPTKSKALAEALRRQIGAAGASSSVRLLGLPSPSGLQ